MMKTIFKYMCSLAFILAASSASAITFSNISYTDSSVTFTANGAIRGAGPMRLANQFSLQYEGDILANPGTTTFSANIWSGSVFDGRSFLMRGNTGLFSTQPNPYTWSEYFGSLSGATASNNTVTVSFGAGFLDTAASNPIINFVWGNGSVNSNPTLLQQAQLNIPAVPLPAAMPLLAVALAAMFGLGAARRRTAA